MNASRLLLELTLHSLPQYGETYLLLLMGVAESLTLLRGNYNKMFPSQLNLVAAQ